jgi:hypothetical protein
MPSDDALARRYRRLLWAYPGWYRRVHGGDMLTALLDAAAAGRRGEGWRLVLDGLRCRLRVRGLVAALLAGFLSLGGAGAFAAAAGWIAWQAAASPWPTVAQATAAAGPVLLAGAPVTVTRYDDVMGGSASAVDHVLEPVLGVPEWEPGGVRFGYLRPPAADPAASRAAVRSRLENAGWRTSVIRDRVIGERAGLRITVSTAGRDTLSEDYVVAVYPTPPVVAYRLGAAAALVGALVGWLVAASLVAGHRRRIPAARAGSTVFATAGAVALLPAALLSLLAVGIGDADKEAAAPWFGFEVVLARPGAVIGALLLLSAWWASRRRTGAAPSVLSPG